MYFGEPFEALEAAVALTDSGARVVLMCSRWRNVSDRGGFKILRVIPRPNTAFRRD